MKVLLEKDVKGKTVYKKFNKELDKYGSTFAALLNSYVSMNDKLANIYNYKSSWDEKIR